MGGTVAGGVGNAAGHRFLLLLVSAIWYAVRPSRRDAGYATVRGRPEMPGLHRSPPLLAIALLALAAPAGATMFVPISDATLADRAPLIVEGRILAVEPAPGVRPAIDYLVEIEQLIKSSVSPPSPGWGDGDTLILRVPGGVRPDGVGLLIRGAPRFREGDEALLFLEPLTDGTFALHQLMLGAFHIVREGGKRVAKRDLSGAQSVRRPGTSGTTPAPADGVRDAGAFRRWLEQRGAGQAPAPAYFLPAPSPRSSEGGTGNRGDGFRTIVSTGDPLPLGCGDGGGHSVRWFDFQTGAGDVGWRTHFSGQAGLPSGGIEAFKRALAAWSDDPNTDIRYLHEGLTFETGGLSVNDGVNAVLFGDPNDEIAGSFDGQGLLAIGGPWFECQTFLHQGERFHPIVAADIVTQDGLELFFASAPDPSNAADQLFAHELGHTLGLAHTEDPEALMYALYHADRRGAALDLDDLAGAFHLYGQGDLSPPAAPSQLTLDETAIGARVLLEWSDNSGDESGFRIERRQAENFELVTTTAAGATSFTDADVEPATLYGYRLSALNGAGASAYTGVAEILTGEAQRPDAPTNLRAAPLSSTEIRLTWQDNSGDETGFVVEILIQLDWVEIPALLGPNTDEAIVSGLPPATSFSFRLRAVNGFGSSDVSNTATTRTFSNDDDCVVTSDELCLLGGRFKISVDYRNQHDGGSEGTATVVPSTDETGLFWFFDPENIELIVKALDGRHINQHFWLFYGALSDVEYQITLTDTASGEARIYHNPPGEICGRADTAAFREAPGVPGDPPSTANLRIARPWDASDLALRPAPDTPEPATLESGTCQPGPETLCLLDGRLSVEVWWQNPHGGRAEGPGRAIADSDSTGMFWFFNIENNELVVKALDGGAINGHLWLFYGALTDLEYWITVTDTVAGEARVYYNPPGEVCGRADTQAFDIDPAPAP